MLVTLDGFYLYTFPFNVSKNTHIINWYPHIVVHYNLYNLYYNANPLLNNMYNLQVF